nr:retrovirus-related Pol polyprotein from transposon TNT 1-94 [Tanacetum cinerariifolium]
MPNPEDIIDPTPAMNMALALMAKAFKLNYSTPTNNNQRISSNPRNRQIAQPGMNMGQDRKMQMVGGNGENQFRQYDGQNVENLNGYNAVQNVRNQVAQNPRVQNVGNQNRLIGVPGNVNQNGNGNLVAARAEGNAARHNGNQIRCYNCRGVGYFARNCMVRPRRRDAAYLQTHLLIAQKEEQASTSGTQTDKAPVYDSDGSAENLAIEVEKVNTVNRKLKETNADLTTELEATKFVGDFKSLAKEADESLAKHKALELEIERLLRGVENEYAKLWNDWYKKCDECKFDKISYDKAYKDMQQKIERLQAQLGDLKGKSTDTSCVSNTLNPLSQKLENENVELEFQVLNYAKENAHLKTTYKNLFDSISVSRTQTKTIISSLQHELYENAKLRAQLFKKVYVQKDNTRVTSNSIPTPQESKVVKNDKVIAPGMFRINPFKTSREEKHVPNNVRASIWTKPITVSQPPIFTKNDVNFDSNGLSSTGIDNTKTRRLQPRSNIKNDRVPFEFKSSRSKNKGDEVEEHHRNLLLSKNKKHMSSECNNVKLATQNVYSKKQMAKVSIKEKQQKRKSKVKKPKKVGSIKRLATPKPSKPRSFLRWSPTGRFFYLKGKIIASSESESQFDCSKGDNACTSNPMEPSIKWFPNATFSLAGNSNMFMVVVERRNRTLVEAARTMLIFSRAPLFLWAKAIATAKPDISYLHVFGALCYPKNDREDIGKLGAKGDIGFFIGYSANSFMYDDYIGGQPSATARTVLADQAPQVRQTSTTSTSIADTAPTPTNSISQATNVPNTSQDVDELTSQQQHYTELLEPIPEPQQVPQNDNNVISELWHQRLSHLNFDTINDLAKNDLVFGLPKFKYHKEHLCPSWEQGKSKRASHLPKPVPNLGQRLHLLHMDLCGPIRIASINGKRYVLVIVDDYSRYTWVHFLRSKDEAPEVIKTFLKRITILLQSPVIIIRTDNDTEFKNQALKEYFDNVGISHKMSFVRTPQQNAIATACFTENRSIIHRRFNKTPYELINGRKPDISFLHVFGALCYPKNDREDIGKLGAKGDIGFFIGYSADSCAYRVYNQKTKKIIETMNVSFDELSVMDFEQSSSKPRLQSMTSGQITMYDDYIGVQPSAALRTVLAAQAHQVRQTPTTSTSIADTATTPTNSSSQAKNFPNISQDVDELKSLQQHAQQQGT